MSTVITETPGNANFAVGLTLPNPGEDFTASCALVLAAAQQLADRAQWLKGWTLTAPTIELNLAASKISSNFTLGTASQMVQSSVAAVGGFWVTLDGALPVGRKITAVTASIVNVSTTNISIGTMPKLTLSKYDTTTGTSGFAGSTTVGSASDTTAVLGTYQNLHYFSLSGLSETISADAQYSVKFEGETGANSTSGLVVYRLFVTLAYA